MPIIEANTIFKTNLTKHEFYQGQSTEKFSLQLALSDEQVEELKNQGVKTKQYEGQPLRKFSSRYAIDVFDENGPVAAKDLQELPNGSRVRLEYVTKSHPTAGEVPYAKRLMILEIAEEQAGESDKEFFEGTPF